MEIVRLESWERRFVLLVSILVPAATAWYFIDDTVGSVVRALATLGASAISLFLIFGWSVLRLPAIMEAEAAKEREALEARLETQNRKHAKREELGRFMSEGRQLMNANYDVNRDPPIDEATQWLAELHTYLSENLSASYLARLEEVSAVPIGMTSLTGDRAKIYSALRVRLYNLEQFCRELA